MDEADGHVIMNEPQWQRLWEKSAIGTRITGGGLSFFDEEVMFVHIHRHQPLPYENWIIDKVANNIDLEDKYFMLEALRVPGNLIQLYPKNDACNGTWALRWHKENHPDRDPAIAEIRWHRALDSIDIHELYTWCNKVLEKGRLPEVLVIDNEGSIVTYELDNINPQASNIDSNNYDNLGIQTRWNLRHSYHENLIIHGKSDGIITDTLLDLINRGLTIRSGFKFGTRWRVYDGPVGEDHAPWLVDCESDAPVDWTHACLNARLASGVNKHYIVGIKINDDKENIRIEYLEFRRPPSDRRWTNMYRY